MKLWRQKVSPNNNNWRGGGKWAGVTPTDPKPEAQVAWFLVGMFWNQFLEAGDDAKVSPKVSLDRKCHQKLCDLRNRESDQNLSVIKVAGNQKLCTT